MQKSILSLPVVRKVLDDVDWDSYRDIAVELLDGGESEEEVVHLLAVALDKALPLQVILPGPVGVAVELVDEFVFELVLRPIVRALRPSEARQAWREHRRKVREERKAARKAKRAGA